MKKYIIEASTDGVIWKRQASFHEGENSRFGEPFSADIAIKEAESFKIARRDRYQFVRIIIEV